MTLEQLIMLINLVVPFIVLLSALLLPRLYARLPEQVQRTVQEVAHTAVLAVEQQFDGLPGEQKRQKAVDLIIAMLQAVGLKSMNPTLINAALEAAVRAMNQVEKPKP
ncbi:LL-H family phage holin [Thermosporothrix hazakensis]|uniref:LL-H family phage holin n=1 Tax=Thermosporothrix hazakensis TaxID=644383 RepID=A0A326TU78_THEHA|nr:phage holin [Thermosporothrix hazakensis]PZW19680.1 LL-H family phage holin [Thermosporothrix hazakensis]GCE49208.1 hypothetical protein KTH_40770 [Thermosporothrix hazakensis]